MSFLEKTVRAYRMSLGQMATELALALIIIAILLGGIAANIFFATSKTWNGSGSFAEANHTYTWDSLSTTIWTYIFPLSLAALLVGIIYHMYVSRVD